MSACFSRFSEGPPEKGPTEGTKGRAGLAGEARRHPTTAGGLEEEGRRLGRPLHGETETFLPAKTVRSKYRRKHARVGVAGAENCDATRVPVVIVS